MKKKIYPTILFAAIIIIINGNTFAQGVGNHLTMSLENCSQPAGNVIQFDLDVVSDGVSTSVLVPNSFQFGINFDTCILQTGDSVIPSYISSSSQMVSAFSLNSPAPLTSTIRSHIRITESIFGGGNSGLTMVVGQKYRYGTFQITCSTHFTSFCPNFTLQDTSAPGHTTTCALVYIGNGNSTSAFCQSGTGNGYRSLSVTCTTCNCTNGIDEINGNPLISFFPNPAADALTVIFPESNTKTEIKIINLLGEVKYSATVNERKTTIDVSSFSNGVYILEATVGDDIRRYKFVVGRHSSN